MVVLGVVRDVYLTSARCELPESEGSTRARVNVCPSILGAACACSTQHG